MGACVNAPMVQISKDTYEDLTPEIFEALLDAFDRGEPPMAGPQNGRQTSTPISGLSSLTEIQYADDDIREARAAPSRSGVAAERMAERQASTADIADEEPRPATAGNVGGEQLEAEQQRRKGRAPKKAGGTDPAGPGTADQEVGRVDPSGRSDEAASRSMGDNESPSSDREG